MNPELGIFSYILTVSMSSFMFTFFLLGFEGRTSFGRKLNAWRSRYRGALPFTGYPKFFLLILLVGPLELAVAILGPMIFLQTILPLDWFGSSLNATNQLMWSGVGFLLSVFVVASCVRRL